MKKSMKVIAIILLVCLSVQPMVFATNDADYQEFTDVSRGDWFYSSVKNVCEKNIFSGTSPNTFEPDVPITRAMFVTVLGKLANIDISLYNQSSFSDVKPSDWCSPYVEWAYQSGIASGTQQEFFSPDSPISREQAAVLIERFLTHKDYIVSNEVNTKYTDAESISDYAKRSVTMCSNAAIFKGDENTNFNPFGDITRAEAAAVITKLDEYITNKTKVRVFNEEDQKKVALGIKVLNKPIKEGIALAKDIYTIAFSKNFSLSGTAHEILDFAFALYENPDAEIVKIHTVTIMEMIAEGLYGGTKINGNLGNYFGDQKTELAPADFITGDIIVLQSDSSNPDSAMMYIYDGAGFSLLKYEAKKETFEDVITTALSSERFVVLRPSYVMHNLNHALPRTEEEMTDPQKAVVATAKNYVLRGYRYQYADTRLSDGYADYRWQFGLKAPEDYTLNEWGYTNCAGFVTDVYRQAVGWNTDMYLVSHLLRAEYIRPFYYKITGTETEAEMKEIEDTFYQEIKPGDIICTRRYDGNGHVMLYVGNGEFIHASGSTYNYTKEVENSEPTARYQQLKDLFTPAGGVNRYIFAGKLSEISLARPLSIWHGYQDKNAKNSVSFIPENSRNRMKNLQGIVAEKLSSHNSASTVNPGDEMTFTFSIFNTNDYDVTLSVSDEVPSNTSYVSGAQKVDGKKLLWEVTVPSNETLEVSYKVRVNQTIDLDNATVYSESGKVGGVLTNCPAVQIKKTLTAKQQEKLINTANSFVFTSNNPVENANKIYNDAFSVKNILSVRTMEDLANGLYDVRSDCDWENRYDLKTTGDLANMVAPSLYGGRKLFANPFQCKIDGPYYRTRFVREHNLITGDIIARFDKESSVLYLYVGGNLLDLSTGQKVEDVSKCLEKLLASQIYFTVLRPSTIMK